MQKWKQKKIENNTTISANKIHILYKIFPKHDNYFIICNSPPILYAHTKAT